MSGMAGFATILGRLAETGAGYLAGTAEREEEARAERSKLVQTGLQLGASGIDASQFIDESMVSRDNRQWVNTKFPQMGPQFTQGYRDAQTRQQQALQGEREFQVMLEQFRQRHQDRRASMSAQATISAAALRANGRDRDEPTVLDQIRLEEETGTLIGRQFGQLFPEAYGSDGKIKKEYGAAYANFEDMVRSRLPQANSLAELRASIAQTARQLGPTLNRTDSSFVPGFISPRNYQLQTRARTPENLLGEAVQLGNQQISRMTTPSQRTVARDRVLQAIEREFGPAGRAQAERMLEK